MEVSRESLFTTIHPCWPHCSPTDTSCRSPGGYYSCNHSNSQTTWNFNCNMHATVLPPWTVDAALMLMCVGLERVDEDASDPMQAPSSLLALLGLPPVLLHPPLCLITQLPQVRRETLQRAFGGFGAYKKVTQSAGGALGEDTEAEGRGSGVGDIQRVLELEEQVEGLQKELIDMQVRGLGTAGTHPWRTLKDTPGCS